MGGTLEEVKKLLSSLIISSAKGLTVRKLQQEFKSEIGQDVPFRKFGFPTLEMFLHSIPDICIVNGHGDFACVIPVINEKVKHINDMILKQKTVKNKNYKGYTYPRSRGIQNTKLVASTIVKLPTLIPTGKMGLPPAEYAYESLIKNKQRMCMPRQINNSHIAAPLSTKIYSSVNNTLKNKSKEQDNYTSEQIWKPINYDTQNNILPTCKSINKSHWSNSCSTRVDNTTYTDYQDKYHLHLDDSPSPSGNKENEVSNCNESFHDHSSMLDEYCTELEFSEASDDILYQSDDELGFDEALENLKIKDDLSTLVPQNDSSRISKSIKSNLRLLIDEHADGIWCAMLPILYKQRFNEDLDYYDFGFSSVSQLCSDVPDIFHCIRPGKTDWKVFDSRKPPPLESEVLEWCNDVKDNYPIQNAEHVYNNYEIAHPDIKPYIEIIYPDAVLKLEQSIRNQWLKSDERELDYIEIIVGEVYDPSKFWIQLKRESSALSQLMDEMQIFYINNARDLQINYRYIREELYCAALFLGEYHRAVILKIFDDDTVKVFYIDYGTVAECKINNICFLHTQFTTLPQQAIRGRLANIIPKEQNTMWTREASAHFLHLIRDRALVGLITFIDYENSTLSLIITDVTGSEDIHINDCLVDEGYAVIGNKAEICATSSAIVPNVHLYPTFDDIERGLCPTVSNLITFHKLNYSYEVIFKDYFKQTSDIYGISNTPSYLNQGFSSEVCNDVEDSYATYNVNVPQEEMSGSCYSTETNVQNTERTKPPPGFEKVNPNLNNANIFTQVNSNLVNSFQNPNLLNYCPPVTDNLVEPASMPYYNSLPVNSPETNIILQMIANPSLQAYAAQQITAYMGKQIFQNLISTQTQSTSMPENSKDINQSVSTHEVPNTDIYSEVFNKSTIMNENNTELINKFVFDVCISKYRIHILKIDEQFYMTTQELISKLLDSPLLFSSWLTKTGLNIKNFPSKVINILNYREVFSQLKMYNIPGVPKVNNLGCNVRVTPLDDVLSIVEDHGNKKNVGEIKMLLDSIKKNWQIKT